MSAALDPKADIVAAGETLRPLRDLLVIEPLDWHPSETIEVVRHGRPLRGIVRAAGPGTYQKRYQRNHQGQKCGFKWSKVFVPTEVKPGDTVELGGLDIYDGAGYAFQQVIIEGKLHLLCQEADVCGVHINP